MSELLLELFSEEIPARMQSRAAEDLARLLGGALKDAGFAFAAVRSFAGPRRLVAVIDDLPDRAADVREERKGPRVGAPQKALDGFLRGAGLASLELCEIREDRKGAFYVAIIEKPGLGAAEALAQIVPKIMRGFPWPKSMKWGAGDFRWVRPLHNILCLLDGQRVDFEAAGLRTTAHTFGHRVMGPGPFAVTGFENYQQILAGQGHVLVDAAARKARIEAQMAALCEAHGLELVPNPALLDEVTGLAEWPVALIGAMDPAFLALPPEVIQLSMAKNQKYFSLRDPKTGALAPHFIVIANLEAPDGGKAIVAGNERVLTARLDDARYFWDTDLKTPLEARVDTLRDVVFHQKLGSVHDKSERVAALARKLAPLTGADPDLAERAARLAKADLVTEMVVEFPALQGVMGRYYALQGGENAAVADAIADHYKPQGPHDSVPTAPVSVAVALADKLDTLTGFWAIDEKPTGSKDPYALRRAALGVIRLVLENGVRLQLKKVTLPLIDDWSGQAAGAAALIEEGESPAQAITANLLAFFHDRLKVYLRDSGARHDLIDAVISPEADDLVAITNRVGALEAFLATPDGAQLLAGAKRAASIVRIEEKRDGAAITGAPDPALFVQAEEKALFAALRDATEQAGKALEEEDYEAAMAALAPLRPVVDAFFDHVTVNADDPALRANRLRLLNMFRESLRGVADFDKITG